eukprot:SAG31_NODE_1873_length_7024_cov_10.615018_3_plen_72_part_00
MYERDDHMHRQPGISLNDGAGGAIQGEPREQHQLPMHADKLAVICRHKAAAARPNSTLYRGPSRAIWVPSF